MAYRSELDQVVRELPALSTRVSASIHRYAGGSAKLRITEVSANKWRAALVRLPVADQELAKYVVARLVDVYGPSILGKESDCE